MTVTMIMLLFGSLMVYAGWTNRSLRDLVRGDNTVAKPAAGHAVLRP